MSRHIARREFLRTGTALGIGCGIGAGWSSLRRHSAVVATAAAASETPKAWKVFIMTDMEGVAGLLDFDAWCTPESRYYELGKEFLTLQVNAAIEGFAAGGAAEFLVADGHGHGGINPKLLDSRAELARNWPRPPQPFSLDNTFHFAAWVGQHAMAGSEYAHLAHTGSFSVLEDSINGRALGEFGQLALCATQLGVRSIFGTGDLAFTKEARELVPGIETVAVKRGTTPGRGDECDTDAYAKRNVAAIHVQPERARQMIRASAERAMRRALVADTRFGLVDMKPPYERTVIRRPDGDKPKRIGHSRHPSDAVALMQTKIQYEAAK